MENVFTRLIYTIMPTYTYHCTSCKKTFELFFYIKDYNPSPKCNFCKKRASRSYVDDVITQFASVKKSDSELKTIGDIAMRNTERMSEDKKNSLHMKHNSYKESIEEAKPLPPGMKRMEKPNKVKWPGSLNKKRRGLSK